MLECGAEGLKQFGFEFGSTFLWCFSALQQLDGFPQLSDFLIFVAKCPFNLFKMT